MKWQPTLEWHNESLFWLRCVNLLFLLSKLLVLRLWTVDQLALIGFETVGFFIVINLIDASFVVFVAIFRYNLLLHTVRDIHVARKKLRVCTMHICTCTCTTKCIRTHSTMSMIYVRDDLLLRLPLFLLADFDDSVVGIPCTPKQNTPTNSTNNTDVLFMLLTLNNTKTKKTHEHSSQWFLWFSILEFYD